MGTPPKINIEPEVMMVWTMFSRKKKPSGPYSQVNHVNLCVFFQMRPTNSCQLGSGLESLRNIHFVPPMPGAVQNMGLLVLNVPSFVGSGVYTP